MNETTMVAALLSVVAVALAVTVVILLFVLVTS